MKIQNLWRLINQKWFWALVSGLIGFILMQGIDAEKSEIFTMSVICCLMVGAAFFEEVKDGRIKNQSKKITLIINSIGIGVSLSCLFFAPGFCWKLLSFASLAITLTSVISLCFVVEGVRD